MTETHTETVFNDAPENHEQDRNIAANCKTQIVPMSRGFGRWLNDKRAGWPDDLQAKGERALLALRSLEQRNVPASFEAAAKADVQAFLNAHAAPHG